MIAASQSLRWLVQLSAPLVWRSQRRIARKLRGFSATEAGSALDMLKAAELCEDPELRRQFFVHALDEARHARMFADQARALAPAGSADAYATIRASRQNLYRDMNEVDFVAFVHLAERAGQTHFAALAEHFAHDEELRELFERIERDERFHVSYSGRQLEKWSASGRATDVRRALRDVRLRRAWEAWRRAGRRIGDVVARVGLGLIYLVCVPVFALIQRLGDPGRAGWHERDGSIGDLRRQF